jgi:hypothetical protein
MKTAAGVSASVSATDIWISMIAFYLIFAVLGVADGYLMVHYGRRALDEDPIATLLGDGSHGGGSGGGPGGGSGGGPAGGSGGPDDTGGPPGPPTTPSDDSSDRDELALVY